MTRLIYDAVRSYKPIMERLYFIRLDLSIHQSYHLSSLRIELSMSPGAVSNPLSLSHSQQQLEPLFLLNNSISYKKLMTCLTNAIEAGKSAVFAPTSNIRMPNLAINIQPANNINTDESYAVNLGDNQSSDVINVNKDESSDDSKQIECDMSVNKLLDISSDMNDTPVRQTDVSINPVDTAPVNEAMINDRPLRMKRVHSVTVVSNSNLENIDTWEKANYSRSGPDKLVDKHAANQHVKKLVDINAGGDSTKNRTTLSSIGVTNLFSGFNNRKKRGMNASTGQIVVPHQQLIPVSTSGLPPAIITPISHFASIDLATGTDQPEPGPVLASNTVSELEVTRSPELPSEQAQSNFYLRTTLTKPTLANVTPAVTVIRTPSPEFVHTLMSSTDENDES